MDLPPCTVGSAHHWRRSVSSGSSAASGSPSSSTSTARSSACRVRLVGGEELAIGERLEDRRRVAELRVAQRPRVEHGQRRQRGDGDARAPHVLARPRPPERDQPERGVGPQRQRLLAARVALDAEVGPRCAADGALRREAGGEALRVDAEVAVEVQPRCRLPHSDGLLATAGAHAALAVRLHHQPPLAVGGVRPQHRICGGARAAVDDIERALRGSIQFRAVDVEIVESVHPEIAKRRQRDGERASLSRQLEQPAAQRERRFPLPRRCSRDERTG